MRISLVTPSFNHGRFLEQTLQSVLSQGYPDLEYMVIDGGSQDNSVEILRRYSDRLAYWVSEKDAGMYDAIQKGFARSTGEIMGWLNSDDMHMPWALSIVGEIFAAHPEIEWLTSLAQIRWDDRGRAVRCLPHRGFSSQAFLAGEYLPRPGAITDGWIQQESTFWRRSLWERSGATVAREFRLAGDFDLWARFFEKGELYGVETPLGGFRYHGQQLTGPDLGPYLAEAERILAARCRAQSSGALRRWARESCPRVLRSLAARFGLLHPVKICRHDKRSGKWKIVLSWN